MRPTLLLALGALAGVVCGSLAAGAYLYAVRVGVATDAGPHGGMRSAIYAGGAWREVEEATYGAA